MGEGRAGRGAVAILGVMALVVGTWLVATSPIFALRRIQVLGNGWLTAVEVVDLAGVAQGDNLFRLSTAEIEDDLRRSPWVASAEVRRVWPSTLVVRLTERRPVAMVRDPEGAVVLAGDGTVLAHSGREPPARGAFPLLPPTTGGLAPGDTYPRAGLLSVARSLPAGLRRLVDRIRLDEEGIILRLAAGGTVLYGSTGGSAAKNAALRSVLREVRRQGIAVDYIDVRIPSAPAVKPVHSLPGAVPRG